MKLRDIDVKGFYPGAVVTTPFGWDTKSFPDTPRIHAAVDKISPGVEVTCPIETEWTKFIKDDGQGNSILRLVATGIELRIYHFNFSELSPESGALIRQGLPIDKGSKIGPAGNTGVCLGADGGRHIHYQLILDPAKYSDELELIMGKGWDDNRIDEYSSKYGQLFVNQLRYRGITVYNEKLIARKDQYWWRPSYIIDSLTVLGL